MEFEGQEKAVAGVGRWLAREGNAKSINQEGG